MFSSFTNSLPKIFFFFKGSHFQTLQIAYCFVFVTVSCQLLGLVQAYQTEWTIVLDISICCYVVSESLTTTHLEGNKVIGGQILVGMVRTRTGSSVTEQRHFMSGYSGSCLPPSWTFHSHCALSCLLSKESFPGSCSLVRTMHSVRCQGTKPRKEPCHQWFSPLWCLGHSRTTGGCHQKFNFLKICKQRANTF